MVSIDGIKFDDTNMSTLYTNDFALMSIYTPVAFRTTACAEYGGRTTSQTTFVNTTTH